MKKILYLSIISLLCASFASCGSNAHNTTINSKKEDLPDVPPFFVYYERNVYDDGYIYHGNDGVNYYLDYETMETSPLCAVPNCDHKSSSCVAQAVGTCPLIFGDYIYYFTSECGVNETADGHEFYINSCLNRISLDSSESEKLAEFHDAVPDTHDGFVVKDGVLYFQADNMNPTEDDYGTVTYTNAGGIHYLCSIDLSNGKYQNYGSIYDGDKEYFAANSSSSARICGIHDGKILLDYSFLKEIIPDEKFEEPGFLVADQFTSVIIDFDLDNNTFQETDMPGNSYVDDNIMIYYDKERDATVILRNNEETLINGNRSGLYSVVLNDKLWNYADSESFYDLSDLKQYTSGKFAQIVDYRNGKYIVRKRGTKFEAIDEGELMENS